MPSPTVAELQEELDRMRNIIGQCRQLGIERTAELLLKNEVLKNERLQNKTLVNTLLLRIEEMERDKLLRSPLSTPNSTIPAHNLQPALNSVAQMDGAIVQTLIDNSHASFETRITNLLTQHQQKHTPGPISAPTLFGATVSSGLPGTLQSQPNPILTVSGRALSNAKGTPNDYDKPVEVEQCKLCESAWKLVFDVCATNAYRRNKIRILYQQKTLTSTHLFSLKLAVITISIPKEIPRTMESPQHTYLAGFYAYVSPSDNTAFQTTNQDISKTLIQALYDG